MTAAGSESAVAERVVCISAPQGLHLRVAATLVKTVRGLAARLTVKAPGQEPASAGSVIDLLRLGAVRGTCVTVRAEGPDAEQALRRAEELFSDGSGI